MVRVGAVHYTTEAEVQKLISWPPGYREEGRVTSGPGSWSWDAAEYARSSAAQQAWAMELIEKLALGGGESVLDIGCGDGKVTAEIARRVPAGRVLGIDCSEDMVRLAREVFPPYRSPESPLPARRCASLPFRRSLRRCLLQRDPPLGEGSRPGASRGRAEL